MSFIDEYLPDEVPGFPCMASPRFKTTIQVNAGGGERRNQEWEHPLHLYTLPEAVARQWDAVEVLKKHWLIMRGPFHTFPFYDPFDFASSDLATPNTEPTVTMTDQLVGTADGFTDTFQLVKTYSVGSETYDRTIHLPILDSVLVAIDGVLIPDTDYTVTRPGGEIVFDVPPPLTAGADIITAGFLFDVEVRFESDDVLGSIMRTTTVGGFADLTLVEVRPC
jgi:uncharacterized protein (TIGR02217 family)